MNKLFTTLPTLGASFLPLAPNASAGVVFFDDFQAGVSQFDDVNTNIGVGSRQTLAGTAQSNYSGDTASHDIFQNQLRIDGGGQLDLEANFASDIGANDFTVEIRGRHFGSTGSNWAAFSVLDSDDNRGSTDMTFFQRNNGVMVVNGTAITEATVRTLIGDPTWTDVQNTDFAFVAPVFL